jgi:hypothetical protein
VPGTFVTANISSSRSTKWFLYGQPLTVFGTLGFVKGLLSTWTTAARWGLLKLPALPSADQSVLFWLVLLKNRSSSYAPHPAYAYEAKRCTVPIIVPRPALLPVQLPAKLTGDRINEYHRRDFKALISFIEEQSGSRLNVEKPRIFWKNSGDQDEITMSSMISSG